MDSELQEQVKLLKEVAEIVDGKYVDDYSGRGMFGRKCAGIICKDAVECVAVAGGRGFHKAHIDNMGLDYIVYWPHVKNGCSMKTYVTFGQSHAHRIGNKILDKDCVAVLESETHKEGETKPFSTSG